MISKLGSNHEVHVRVLTALLFNHDDLEGTSFTKYDIFDIINHLKHSDHHLVAVSYEKLG